MYEKFFDLQRFTDVLVGKSKNDELFAMENKTQIYGLAGNDTLVNNGKNEIHLIGGSGDDVINVTGGSGTLSGGKGADTFNLAYSADKKIETIIEDIEPSKDKILVTFDGIGTPKLNYSISGGDIVWKDDKGYFNLTLKGGSDASDYYEGEAHEYIWDILRITNKERETQGLNPLTLSQGLTDGAMIRSREISEKYEHVRPDGTSCFTAVEKSYRSMGENIYSSPSSPEDAMTGWMNSSGHRANILSESYSKLGVGYTYDADSQWKYHWVQMFGGCLNSPETISTDQILKTSITVKNGSLPEDETPKIDSVLSEGNTNIKYGGTYTISENFSGTIRISTTEAVTINGTNAGNLKDFYVIVNTETSDLTIKNLNVTNETGSVIKFGNGTDNKLTIEGTNNLKSSDTWAAVVNVGGGLTIDGMGTLNAEAGYQAPCIGYSSYRESTADIIINGGIINVTANAGAAIGSGCKGAIGNITINGGVIKARSDTGAGIGSGWSGSVGDIYIGGNANIITTSEFASGVGLGCDDENGDNAIQASAGNIKISGKSTVLITQLDINALLGGVKRQTDFLINNEIYTDKQLLFENGIKKTLSERIIVEEIVKNGTDKSEYLNANSNSWYDATTVDAGKGDDTISGSGANIFVYAGVGNDSVDIVGSGWSDPVVGYVTVDAGEGNDNLEIGAGLGALNDYYSSINGGDGDDSIRVNGNYFTVEGGTGDDDIVVNGEYSVIDGGAGNDTIYTGENSTVSGGKGNDLIENESSSHFYVDSNGNFLRWAENKNVTYQYTSGDGNDTIVGISSSNIIRITGAKYSSVSSGEDLKINVGDGSILIKGGSNVSFKIDGNYNEKASWRVHGTTATYGTSSSTFITVSGIKTNAPVSGINLSGNVVTLSNSVLNQNTVTVSNGYTLKLADDVAKTTITNAAWSVSGNTATYKATATTAGYSLSSDGKTINYTSASGGNTLVTVSGLKSNAPVSGITLNGNVVTLSNSVLNQGTVGVSSGYTLKLADDVVKSSTTPANWSVSGTTATYKANATSAGYSLSSDSKTINYISASGGNELVKVDGLKANAPTSGISLNGSVVTLSNSVLNQGTVSVSNGYTLKLANDVVKSSTTDANWSVSGTTATYKANATSAGYSLSSDRKTINYSEASGGETFTIIGLKNGLSVKNGTIEGISIKGNVVVVSSNIIGDDEAKIVGDGYTLEIVKIVPIPDGVSIKNNVLTASNKFKDETINLNEEWAKDATKINTSAVSRNISIIGNTASTSITAGKGADTIFAGLGNDTLTGGKGNDIFVYEGGNDIITDYKSGEDQIKLNLADVTKSSVKGSDVILTTNNGTLTVKGMNDKLITFIDENGNTTDKIFFNNTSYEPLEDGLTYDKKKTTLTASNKFISNEIDLGEYLETVTNVNASALSQDVNIVGNGNNNSIKGSKGADTINGGDGKDTLFGGNGNDKIYGDADNDVLKGDAGNDSLNGGTGNDTLTGGAGSDVFIYEGGNDVITDYKSGEDKIKLDPRSITSSTVKGSEVILTTSNGTLTVKSTKDKVIDFVDNNGKTTNKIFFADTSYTPLTNGLSYDAKRIVLTTSNKFTGNTINLGNYLSTVTKVNASATSQSLNIVGNSSDNSIKGGKSADTINGGAGKDTILGGTGNDKIYGGNGNDILQGDAGNDTLYGGSGNDTLTGSAGNDIFVYESGNDVIKDYKTNEDKINLNLSAITSSSVKGSDVILTTSNGTLTVKGTKDKVITFVDSNGKISERIFFGNTSYEPLETGLAYDAKRVVLTASNKFTGSKIDLGDHLGTVTKLNSSATSQNLNIIGNSADNSIKAGKGADTISGGNGKDTIFGGAGNDSIYGGNDNDKLLGDAGNDTLNGGRGNDTLTGGAGNDVFIYEGGNDVITDYTAEQDKIEISSGKISKTTYSGKDVIFTIGSGTLTVKNSKGKKITVTDSSNKTQTYSKTLDLLYDNNFVSDEFGIADVVDVTENNYSVGKLEYSSNNNELANNSIVSASYFDEK